MKKITGSKQILSKQNFKNTTTTIKKECDKFNKNLTEISGTFNNERNKKSKFYLSVYTIK